jgi:hypothetical protein
MREFVCNYATLRFLPYRETGEFVNVGVVIYCPEIDFFDFKLSERQGARVRHFFPELDKEVLRAALFAMKRELLRHRNTGRLFADPASIPDRLAAFRSLVRRRESLLHFSEVGMLMSADPVHTVRRLYDRFVNRDFAQQKEYQEVVMRRRLDDWLKEWNLRRRYKVDERVGGKEFRVKLPFVHRDGAGPVKAIKPLSLTNRDTTNVYEHGDAWVSRMRRLRETGYLPDCMIFAVTFPEAGDQRNAAEKIREDLESLKVEVVPFAEKERIRELAAV